ncbi:MAG TPA: FKBP-type peptidyl-prolyl cis-trans isomerase [Anaeromyxobacteraceae bacterium]|jgi:FKBP-type peptidyl-prolyl cis-trans isomerase FkpA
MNRKLPVLLAALLAFPALSQEPKSEEQKTLYALGLALAREVGVFALSPAEFEMVRKGLTDGVTGNKPAVDLDEYNPKIQALAGARRKATGEKLAAASKDFADKAAREKGAERTESGLVYLSLKGGTGASPAAADTVKVHYRGTLVDGKEFDSSYRRGQPAEFPLGNVIKCWTEGVQKMKAGGKARLVCPPSIAYGERGMGGAIPPNATLVFEIELLDIVKKK